MSLHPCFGCARHVHADERFCPFCNAALPAHGAEAPGSTSGRLTRAAVFAGAALMLSACSSDRERGVRVDSGATADASGSDGGDVDSGVATDAGFADVGVALPYGAPPSRARVV